ncbi:MAG: hypothetical protein Ct9H300mP1_28070 [Planctomycetaceae bacterium]|nr:MAG: hypothetical protein Ct9H300mP1_28070 [Planctomycetaceae bacterium]
MPGCLTVASDVHLLPSVEVMMRTIPLSPPWALASRKQHSQRFFHRSRSVKAQWGALSQIFVTETSVGLGAGSAAMA